MTVSQIPPLHQLVLGWLAGQKRHVTRSLLRSRLKSRAPASELDAALVSLVGAGLVEAEGSRLKATEAGRARAIEIFGKAAWPVASRRLPWIALGIAPPARRRVELAAAVLCAENGLDMRACSTREQVASVLAARATGAHGSTADALARALVGRWLRGPAVVPRDDLPAFAARVLDVARQTRTGRFGDNKVFISHVLRALGSKEDVEALKGRVLEAHRARLLTLARADLVEAMDPRDVAESEVRYLHATFHFIRL
jgi:hypothetical protein